jgi:uncharacterized delta-60 repeat protein
MQFIAKQKIVNSMLNGYKYSSLRPITVIRQCPFRWISTAKTCLITVLMVLRSTTPLCGAGNANPGTLDPNFHATGSDARIYCIWVQSDGKILVGGDFTNFNGIAVNGLTRLQSDGSTDASFKTALAGTMSLRSVRSICTRKDGRILIAGDFAQVNGITRTNVAQLLVTGELDPDFASGWSKIGTISCITLQPDGKAVLGGSFGTKGIPNSYIARLNADGTQDVGFNTGRGPDRSWPNSPSVKMVAVQLDGKILVGGEFDYFDNQVYPGFVRLNNTGSIDTNFSTTLGYGSEARCVVIQPGGNILVGGSYFYSPNGKNQGLTRLNSNGSRDTAFDQQVSVDGYVYALAAQTDGKLLIGGDLKSLNGVPCGNLVRLNANGTLDTNLVSGFVGGSIRSLAVQNDDKIIVGGSITNLGQIPLGNIARIVGAMLTPLSLSFPNFDRGVFTALVATVTNKNYFLEYKTQVLQPIWSSLPPIKGTGGIETLMDTNAVNPTRIYRVRTDL